MDMMRVPEWEAHTWLRHGFSSRAGGLSQVYGADELNLGLTREDDAKAVRANRGRLVDTVGGGDAMRLVTARQVHGVAVTAVRAGDEAAGEADGMLTDVPGVLLGIQVADCVPVLVADVRRRVVGAFHAGWRGTAAAVVEVGIARMSAEFGTKVEDLVGAVGPSIGRCCYVVGEEVREAFEERFGYAAKLFHAGGDGVHLDLAEANRRQMVGAGVAAEQVSVLGECTACARGAGGERKYFSHRAEGGVTGRGIGAIGMAAGA